MPPRLILSISKKYLNLFKKEVKGEETSPAVKVSGDGLYYGRWGKGKSTVAYGNAGMKVRFGLSVLLVLAGLGHFAEAHLTANSLKPIGGETFEVMVPVQISWSVTKVIGGKTDIAFSKDAGSTWTTFKSNFSEQLGSNTFTWNGPDAITNNGKIRICQKDSVAKVCTDANRVSSPNSGPPYVLVSGIFKVTGNVVKMAAAKLEVQDMALIFHSDSRNLDVSFTAVQREPVLLEAFDAQGHRIADLIHKPFAAGPHRLSIFSNRFLGHGQALLFKLQVGGEVKTQRVLLAQ